MMKWKASMSQIPIGWLMNDEGFEMMALMKQQVNDARCYTKPTPLFLPKGHY